MDTPKVRKRAPRQGEGRPTIFTQELADKICEQIILGKSLKSICEATDMPNASSVFKWIGENDEFSKKYAYACQERSEAMLEEILDISDEGIDVIKQGAEKKSGALAQIVRLKVDTRKWYMSKMKPKKYGDKLDVTSGGEKLPTPILNAVPNNISTTQDTESK